MTDTIFSGASDVGEKKNPKKKKQICFAFFFANVGVSTEEQWRAEQCRAVQSSAEQCRACGVGTGIKKKCEQGWNRGSY
jgi:hypothetical protein